MCGFIQESPTNKFDNYSIANQKQGALDFVKASNYILTQEFGGTYESAKGDFTRKEFRKLIETVRSSKKKPKAILIFKINRFSRSGGSAVGLVTELIHQLGVHLIEISSGKNTFTARGEAEIMDLLIQARVENIARLEHTLPGLISHVKNGLWLGKAPKGYTHVGKKVKNENNIGGVQKISLNEDGKILQMAWQWKLQGEPDSLILVKLDKLGVNVSKQFLSAMWRNPFYCGISTHNFLKGNAIKGKWEVMVSPKDFKTINRILDEKSNTGYRQSKFCEERPLQSILFCGICGTKMTGYKAKKKIDYYACQNKQCSSKDMNANTTVKCVQKGLNNLFGDYLNTYSLNPKYLTAFKAQMKLTVESIEKEHTETKSILEARMKEKEAHLEKLEKKYVFDSLDSTIYQKLKGELMNELSGLRSELAMCKEKMGQIKKLGINH